MKLILTKDELLKRVNRFNTGKARPYYVVCDLECNRNLFKKFDGVSGIVGLPASVEGKMIFFYYISNESLYELFKHEMNNTSPDKMGFTLSELNTLIKKRLAHGYELFGRETLLNDMVFFYKSGYIKADFLIRKKTSKHLDRLTSILTTVPLDKIKVYEEYALVGETRYPMKSLITTNVYKQYYFRAVPYQQIASKSDIEAYLKRKYRELVIIADSINDSIETRKDAESLESFISIVEDLYKSCSNEGVKELNTPANLLIEFLVDFNCNKIKSIETSVLDVIITHKRKFKGLKMNNASLDYMKSTRIDKEFQGIKRIDEEVRSVDELQYLINIYNAKYKHKLLLDDKRSKQLYNISKQISNIIPVLLYLQDSKKFVVVYQFTSKEMLNAFCSFTGTLERNISQLNKEDVGQICERELQAHKFLAFGAQAMMSIKHLHRAQMVESNQFVAELKSPVINNLADLLRRAPLDNIVLRGDKVYIKIKGVYKLKPFKYTTVYSNGGYETIIKLCTKDCCVVDRLLADLNSVDNYEESYDFIETTKFLSEKLMKKLKVYTNNSSAWEHDYINYKHFYDVCKRNSIDTMLTEILDNVFYNQETTDKNVLRVRKLVNSIR